MKRLGLVIPYRDRQEHLSQLIPHLNAYFSRDKVDKDIAVHILVVEQPPGLPFNRGLMRNIGYLTLRSDIDYVCFHDVDYIPLWADYSYPDKPVMLVWFGLEDAFLARLIQNPENYFGGVTLIQNRHFEAANGFSNDYWGWGHEDVDLKLRLEAAGHKPGHRKGTFSALEHVSERYVLEGQQQVRSPANARNWSLVSSRWNALADASHWRKEGLNSTLYSVVKRWPVPLPHKEREMTIEQILVEFPHRP